MPRSGPTRIADRRSDERRTKSKKSAFLNGYKHMLGCADCGEDDHRVLDFDHEDPTAKHERLRFGSGRRQFQRLGWRNMLAEIAKCEVRCANCHRLKTWLERRVA